MTNHSRSLQKPLRVLRLGKGALNCVAWSPDRHSLALGGDDQIVYVFTPKGELRWRRKKHTAPIESLAWSPDGRCLASGSDDCTVRLWSLDGTELHCINGHEGIVAGIAWSPDSRRLVSGSDDRTLRLWSADDGTELRRLEGHEGAIWSVAWSPDGLYLASGSGDRSVRLWSATTGAEWRRLTEHTHQVTIVAWSPDSRRLASGARDRTVRLWSVEDGTELHRLEGREVLSMAWAPDGQCLALGSSQGAVRLWSPDDDDGNAVFGVGSSTVLPGEGGANPLRRLKGHEESVWGVAWSSDGSQLAAVARDGTLALWEVATPLVSTPVPVVDAVQWLARQAATVGRRAPPWVPQLPGADAAGSLGILRAEVVRRSGAPCIALSPDGRRLASGHLDGYLRCWNLMDGRLLWTSVEPIADSVSGSGSTSSRSSQRVAQDLAWSPDGRSLATGAEDGTVSLWSIGDGVELHRLSGHRAPVSSIAWSPDSSCLASGSADRTVRLWSAEKKVELRCLKGHTDLVRSVAWSPDGRQLASGSQDCTIRLWSATDGKELRRLEGHAALVYGIAWSPLGNLLASGSQDQTIRLWSVADGREQQRLEGHQGAVLNVAWSPDGTRLASGSMDSTVRVWDPLAVGTRHRLPLRSFTSQDQGYSWRLAWASGGRFLASSHTEDTIRLWDTRDLFPTQTVGRVPSTAETFRPLSALPAALTALHRLEIHPPLSLVHDLRTLLGGDTPPALETLLTGPEGEKVRDLQHLGWPGAARTGLIALLLHGLPDDAKWHPSAELAPAILRPSLTTALTGEPIHPTAPPPPLAFLRQAVAAIDDPLLTLIAALGPEAVAADPGILLRLRHRVTQLPCLNPLQRRLLRRPLTPLAAAAASPRNGVGISANGKQIDGWNGKNAHPWSFAAPWEFPAEAQRELPPNAFSFTRRDENEWLFTQQYRFTLRPHDFLPLPCLRPTVIILDGSPACHGAIEVLLRPAAHALAATLHRQHLPAVLVSAGGQPTVHLLEQPADFLTLLTQRSPNPPDPISTLAVATAVRRQLVGNDIAWREPIILLLTQSQWGAEAGGEEVRSPSPPHFPHLRALFVRDATLESQSLPVWAGSCERWEAIRPDQHEHLPEVLGRLIG
ncbi:hypothetical protein CCP3SC15_70044 [Gammaproteobacteria bacterium]